MVPTKQDIKPRIIITAKEASSLAREPEKGNTKEIHNPRIHTHMHTQPDPRQTAFGSQESKAVSAKLVQEYREVHCEGFGKTKEMESEWKMTV
ncbi:hypothetical protein EYR40_010693 [Pleurotus pulmonarius]|nr:hypothetical protein EYR36_002465 [Pleurotus pulmonarius]KAF4586678.1 hypothetical protein EYR40_010693 [Pleurotus pulmonarius]